jgi:RNA recognition motif-containing protein
MKFFSDIGPVADVAMKANFAFVEFENAKDADHAADTLNGSSLHG